MKSNLMKGALALALIAFSGVAFADCGGGNGNGDPPSNGCNGNGGTGGNGGNGGTGGNGGAGGNATGGTGVGVGVGIGQGGAGGSATGGSATGGNATSGSSSTSGAVSGSTSGATSGSSSGAASNSGGNTLSNGSNSTSGSTSSSGGNSLSNGSQSGSEASSGGNSFGVDASDHSEYISQSLFIPSVAAAAPAQIAGSTVIVDRGVCGPRQALVSEDVNGVYIGMFRKSKVYLGKSDRVVDVDGARFLIDTGLDGRKRLIGHRPVSYTAVIGVAGSRSVGLGGGKTGGDWGNAGASGGSSMQRLVVQTNLESCVFAEEAPRTVLVEQKKIGE